MRVFAGVSAVLGSVKYFPLLAVFIVGCDAEVKFVPAFEDDGRKLAVYVYEDQKEAELVPVSEALTHLHELSQDPTKWIEKVRSIASVSYKFDEGFNPDVEKGIERNFHIIEKNSTVVFYNDGHSECTNLSNCPDLHIDILFSNFWETGRLESNISALADEKRLRRTFTNFANVEQRCALVEIEKQPSQRVANVKQFAIVIDKSLAEGRVPDGLDISSGLLVLKCVGRATLGAFGLNSHALTFESVTSRPHHIPNNTSLRKHDLAVFKLSSVTAPPKK